MHRSLHIRPAQDQVRQAASKPAQAKPAAQSQKKSTNASTNPKKAVRVHNYQKKDCAVLVGDPLTPVIVAKTLAKDSLISCKLKTATPHDCDAYLGFTIEVDLANDQVKNEALGFGVRYQGRRSDGDVELASKHIISVKFPRDAIIVVENARQSLLNLSELFPGAKCEETTLVRVTLPEDSSSIVEGFGIPFSDSETRTLEGWLNGNQPVKAGYSLADIISQRKFAFFLDFSVSTTNKKFFAEPLPEQFQFPYKTVHAKLDGYIDPIKEHKGHQLLPNFCFESAQDHNIAVNHSVVQDMMWVYLAALEIKEKRRPVYFALRDETPLDFDSRKKHHVIMSLADDFMAMYGDAWRRLAKSIDIKVEFYESEEISGAPIERWVGKIIDHPETIPGFVENHAPVADKDLVMQIEKINAESRLVMKSLTKQVFAGRSAANRAMSVGKNHDVERKIAATDSLCLNPAHPEPKPLNIAGWNLPKPDKKLTETEKQTVENLYDMMLLHRVLVGGAGFWVWQMKGSDAPRSLPVINFLEFGNDALAQAIVEEALPDDQDRWGKYLQRRPLAFGMVSAGPGTGKTTMMAAATIAMAARLGKVLCSAPTHFATSNFARCIYKRSCAVTDRYKAKTAGDGGSPGYRRLTVVRGYKLEFEIEAFMALLEDPTLGDAAVPSHKFLGNSQWRLHLSPTYWLLMVLGSPAVPKLDQDDSAELWSLYNGPCEPAMTRLRQVARGQLTWDQYKDAGAVDASQITGFLEVLLSKIDILCVTPGASDNIKLYWKWKHELARAFAIDEAGNMSCADLYCVWGNTLQPCFLGGDPKQLPPTVISSMDKDADGNYRNRFANYGRISALLKFQAMGMPMYRLNQQLRMARGMFDMSASIIYPDVSFLYNSNCNTTLPEFKIGVDLDKYLRNVFPKLAAPPPGKLRPVFLHCPKSNTVQDPVTGSKRNAEQVTVALDIIAAFVKAMRVDPSRIGIISPYGANVAEIEEQLMRRQYEHLGGMPSPSTVDSFQGQENDIIFLVMGTTARSGPGFTVDPARLNVAITRPRSGLVLVGDINTAGLAMDANGKPVETKGAANKTFEFIDTEGNICVRKAPALRAMIKALVKDGRVVVAQ